MWRHSKAAYLPGQIKQTFTLKTDDTVLQCRSNFPRIPPNPTRQRDERGCEASSTHTSWRRAEKVHGSISLN